MKRPLTIYKSKGFTLIELLVVISIIGMLSSIVLSSVNSARAKSRDIKRIQDIIQIRSALELYAGDHGGMYPLNKNSSGSVTGAFIGTTPGCHGYTGLAESMSGLVPTYIKEIPKDPKPIGTTMCYMYGSSGINYKFMVLETAEFNTQSPKKHTLADPHLGTSGTIDRFYSLSIYTTNYDPNNSENPGTDW